MERIQILRVVHASTLDIAGGAARAAYRVHQGLQEMGITSQMVVHRKSSDDPSVRSAQGRLARTTALLSARLDPLPLRAYPRRSRASWSVNWMPNRVAEQIRQGGPDIIHLHSVGSGFVPVGGLARIDKPIVWTLHDMWAFTGGCHYDQGCGRYQQSCGACPLLASNRETDLSRWTWRCKRHAWRNAFITVVAPSRWLAECAKSSGLFSSNRIVVIPYGLDLSRFKPHDKLVSRALLSLPVDKQLILFGAAGGTSDSRKGFRQLQQALQQLASVPETGEAELVVFGASAPAEECGLGMPSHYMGSLHDDISLSLLFASADVFVAPSTQDNFPNTVMEALACGTPCVAFRVGGMPDMIEHTESGYLAEPYVTDDLAKGIAWVLQDEARWHKLSQRAHERARREFALKRQAQQYMALYAQILPQGRSA
jgi:glycosyltransferase involved in cell wall biosynthesis